jgi:hypothetical protein
MASRVGVKILFDECVSSKIAEVLDHCASRCDPPFSVHYVTDDEFGICETKWLPKRAQHGYVLVSSDMKMRSDHDIAKFAALHNAKIFLLDARVSQQHRWNLLKWLANNLTKIVSTVGSTQEGTTWIVYHDCKVTIVEPNVQTIPTTNEKRATNPDQS